jgi:hypothetical protein
VTRRLWLLLTLFVLGCMAEAWIVSAVMGQCEGGACPVPQYVVPAQPQQRPHPAVCRVKNQRNHEAWYGSGTLIDSADGRGVVITCHHLFREAVGVIVVTFPGGQSYQARLLGQDPQWDLAALEIANPPSAAVAISQDYPRPGEVLKACGYGPNGRYVCSIGEALGYTRPAVNATYETLEMRGAAREGDSGGPVFNAKGELCAVLWGTDGRTIGSTFCGRVRKFLAGILGRRQPPVGGIGGMTPPSTGGSGGAQDAPPPPATPAAPLVPVCPQQCDGISEALAQIKALKDDLKAIREGASKPSVDANAFKQAVEATVGQQVSEAVSSAVASLKTQQDGLGGRLERIGNIVEKIQQGRAAVADAVGAAASSSSAPSPVSWLGGLASSAATNWLVGLGVASPVAGGLVLLGRWMGKRAATKIAGKVAARGGSSGAVETSPAAVQSAAAQTPSVQTTLTVQPDDYAKTWALHRQATGGNVQHDALRCQLYEEAVVKLRVGEINVGTNGPMIADAIDAWVINQFYERVTSATPIENVYHTALRGFLYQEAVNNLRSGKIQCLGNRETADALETWVRREFVKRVQQGSVQ